MTSKESDLVDNSSEIYKKECKGCMERKKIKSLFEFIGLTNDKLHYKCKKRSKKCLMSINGLINKYPNTYHLCDGGHNKFVLLLKKVFIPMNKRIAGKDLMKHHDQIKKLSTVNQIYKTLLMKTMHMLKKYGKYLK